VMTMLMVSASLLGFASRLTYELPFALEV
jgi:hypothetical protein